MPLGLGAARASSCADNILLRCGTCARGLEGSSRRDLVGRAHTPPITSNEELPVGDARGRGCPRACVLEASGCGAGHACLKQQPLPASRRSSIIPPRSFWSSANAADHIERGFARRRCPWAVPVGLGVIRLLLTPVRLFCCGFESARLGFFRSGALVTLLLDNALCKCPWPPRHVCLRVSTILTHGLAPMQGGSTGAILCFCMPNPCCDFRQAEAVGIELLETARSKLLRVPVPMGFRTGRHCGRSSGSLHMPPRWHDEDRFALHGNLFYVTRYVFSRYFLLDIPTCTPLGMLM